MKTIIGLNCRKCGQTSEFAENVTVVFLDGNKACCYRFGCSKCGTSNMHRLSQAKAIELIFRYDCPIETYSLEAELLQVKDSHPAITAG
ncbi:MAG TPA: hypothetical protein VLE72_02830 [Candidatus Saccharimonadales bacterium]|nr:hypothetical protein [Candidatus Saccharimonadales bacterium]